jgi:hypothetical protein
MKLPLSLLLTAALMAVASGCGAGRSLMTPSVPAPAAAPAQGPAFKLSSVRDERAFQAKPPQANIPSLDADDISDPALKARAIGRKRGTFGKARGDILLPTDSSVTHVVAACLRTALARAGGVLVDDKDPRFASARPLEMRVQRFWSWLRPGAWQVQVEFDAELTVRGPLAGFEAGRVVTAHAELRKGAMTDARWLSSVNDGLDQLVNALTQAFQRGLSSEPKPSGAAP